MLYSIITVYLLLAHPVCNMTTNCRARGLIFSFNFMYWIGICRN